MLKDSIADAQQKDSEATLFLIEKFKPLLKKYAYKLHYEDAYYDLQLDFIRIIQDIKLDMRTKESEGALVNYICNSVHHAYCKRLKYIMDRSVPMAELDALANAESSNLLKSTSMQDASDFSLDLAAVLTEKERRIIELAYGYQLSSAEIARNLHTTRQNINQCKKRAERKLRKYYEER